MRHDGFSALIPEFITRRHRKETTEKFTGKSEIYAKYRPDYPAACIDYLLAAGGFEKGGAVAERTFGDMPDFILAAASAEDTGLGNGCAGLVTAAQAFHWFDRENLKKNARGY